MKTLKYILFPLLLTIFCVQQTSAQAVRVPMEEIMNAFRIGRVHEISRYFDGFVPISINNNQSIYSSNQAELVLRDFLEKNPPRDFTVMDSGSPSPTSKFFIANFLAPSGRYNLYVLLRAKDRAYVIREIKLNKE